MKRILPKIYIIWTEVIYNSSKTPIDNNAILTFVLKNTFNVETKIRPQTFAQYQRKFTRLLNEFSVLQRVTSLLVCVLGGQAIMRNKAMTFHLLCIALTYLIINSHLGNVCASIQFELG